MESLRRSNMPWYVYPTWLLQDIVTPATGLVVACYWLGKAFQSGDCPQSKLSGVSVQTHGVNCVMMLVDAMLNQQPVVLLHSIYFMLYMLLYSVFLGLYCIYSGRSLYGIAAWHDSPAIGALGTVAMVLLVCPLLELLLWHWWRLQSANNNGCYTEYTRPSDEEDTPDQPSSFSILFAVKNADFSTDRPSKGRLDVFKAFGESGLPGLRQHRKVFLAMRVMLFLYMLSVSVQSISRWGPYQQSAACMTANEAKCSSCEPYWAYLTHWTLTVEVVYLGFACMTTYKIMGAAAAGDAATPTQAPTQLPAPSPIAAPVAGGSVALGPVKITV
jgi:hypothetical protein